jgi:hypothetical protein
MFTLEQDSRPPRQPELREDCVTSNALALAALSKPIAT